MCTTNQNVIYLRDHKGTIAPVVFLDLKTAELYRSQLENPSVWFHWKRTLNDMEDLFDQFSLLWLWDGTGFRRIELRLDDEEVGDQEESVI
jgi:hypothetical protein